MKTSHLIIGLLVIAVIGFVFFMSMKKKTTTPTVVYSNGQNPSTNPSTYLVPVENAALGWLGNLLTTKKTAATSPASNATQQEQDLALWSEGGDYIY